MKAVVLHEADDMRLEERPVPEPGPGEVLLEVNVTSICGTDVEVLHRKLLGHPEGEFIMGHEYAERSRPSGPAWTRSRSATASPSRCTRGASAARIASGAGTPPASTTATWPRGTGQGVDLRRRLRRVRGQPRQHALQAAGQPHLRAGMHGDHGRFAALGDRPHGWLPGRRDGARARPETDRAPRRPAREGAGRRARSCRAPARAPGDRQEARGRLPRQRPSREPSPARGRDHRGQGRGLRPRVRRGSHLDAGSARERQAGVPSGWSPGTRGRSRWT